jgi:hypothetical protein
MKRYADHHAEHGGYSERLNRPPHSRISKLNKGFQHVPVQRRLPKRGSSFLDNTLDRESTRMARDYWVRRARIILSLQDERGGQEALEGLRVQNRLFIRFGEVVHILDLGPAAIATIVVQNSSFDANQETDRTLDIMKLRLGADAPEQNPALWAQFAATLLKAESPAGWPIPEVRRRSLYESPIQRLSSEMRVQGRSVAGITQSADSALVRWFSVPEGHSIVHQEN